MLSIFRTNQLLITILLLFYAAALHSNAWLMPVPWEPSGFGIAYHWLDQVLPADPTWQVGATVVLLFVGAFLLNLADLQYRFSRDINMLPGLFFVLVGSTLPQFLHPSPLHFANILLLVALLQILETPKKSTGAPNIFNAGFFIALASFFCPAYLVFLFLLFVALNILRGWQLKERLMVLIGALTPYLLLATGCFWFDQLPLFLRLQLMGNLEFLRLKSPLPTVVDLWPLGILMAGVLLVVASQGRLMNKRVNLSQKRINILYWFLLLAVLTLLFQEGIQLDHVLALALPLGALLGLVFNQMSPRWGELLHLLWLAAVFFFQYRSWLFQF